MFKWNIFSIIIVGIVLCLSVGIAFISRVRFERMRCFVSEIVDNIIKYFRYYYSGYRDAVDLYFIRRALGEDSGKVGEGSGRVSFLNIL